MTDAKTAKQVTKAIRKAGFAVDCVKGDGYIYFLADNAGIEIDSVYVCYLYQQTVEEYVAHVAGQMAKELDAYMTDCEEDDAASGVKY